MFSEDAKKQLENLVKKYPTRKAALLPALWMAQEEYGGYVPPAAIAEVATLLQLPAAEVEGVATFYTMYNKTPVGKHHLEVCHNIACMVVGADELIEHIGENLGIGKGETTADKKFTLNGAECLGACANAPCMMVGPKYYENLTPAKVDQIIEDLARS